MTSGDGRTRAYRSELRDRQAAETRRRVVDAAIEVFGQHGYQAATFAQIAKRAGVSVETVRRYGPKTAILWAAVEVASFGVEGRDLDFFATERGATLLRVPDRDAFAVFVAETMLGINESSAGVWAAVTGAATGDRELRGHLTERLAEIRRQVERVLRLVAERGWLRSDVPFDDLVETFCVITSVESYQRFVRLDGKSHEEYSAFVARTVRETILDGAGGAGPMVTGPGAPASPHAGYPTDGIGASQ
ncbi:TetR/AcrR family transcriptional regulator [Plantactinospora sp. BC1]|uniref:TetR/AcrR family transcriptional regulator n=1 Tax=Plantactinospora sp. BC1 TaxID=2108470 RepID=UPI000D1643B7|nr:TetR/AcrR family transcriptional regulator [Plantactinospora sp. BC1]AVT28200.1 TetR/AcrR family transcriptional regulator [Plantactinospora sp. BC1]